MKKRPLEVRLREKSHRDPSGCLLWDGVITYSGYGRIKVDNVDIGAHRVAYETWVGPIPPGLEIDHLCRVRNCIEPMHLEAVTRLENMLRSEGVVGVNARKDRCSKGHGFTTENTYVDPHGSRRCRVCRAEYRRTYKERRA